MVASRARHAHPCSDTIHIEGSSLMPLDLRSLQLAPTQLGSLSL
jgi:hypothetical protein